MFATHAHMIGIAAAGDTEPLGEIDLQGSLKTGIPCCKASFMVRTGHRHAF